MTAPAMPKLELEWLPGRFVVCRLPADAAIPEWNGHERGEDAPARLLSITRTERELSIVIDESALPANLNPATPVQRGFAAMRIVGTLDFALVGVLARLTSTLAAANISVFVISTYETDIILVREADLEQAEHALRDVARFKNGESP